MADNAQSVFAFNTLPAELRLLLRCARWPLIEEDHATIRTLAAADDMDWKYFLALCGHHRVAPLVYRALDPFIQVLKPVSPLAWMPLALYTIKDSSLSSIFVIFICSLWPMLINTAFGVASVRKEWLNVARTLEVGPFRRAFTIILPAAAPTILTGMRISIGIAWLVIVAAEMLVGGTGIGYFVWNEWNNLSITNVITAILVIGVVGMVLDQILARATRLVTFPE